MESTSKTNQGESTELWPSLPFEAWKDTCETLHMWTQIVGKVRLALSPPMNHWWQVPFYVTARGLTTSPIPAPGEQGWIFEVQFDFIDHNLLILTSDGTNRTLPLIPRSVAAFYQEFMASLHALGIEVTINTLPSEVKHPIRCDEDEVHASYDPVYAHRFWLILVQVDKVFKEFSSHFIGKCSPVHFFWGSFDLTVTRFSGRRAPRHPGGAPHVADSVMCEAYSHHVSSAGFWPGGPGLPEPAFYSYAYPEPEGFSTAPVLPAPARYDPTFREFILPYEAVRAAPSPDLEVRKFLETSYVAAAELGGWARSELERPAAEAVSGQEERDDLRV